MSSGTISTSPPKTKIAQVKVLTHVDRKAYWWPAVFLVSAAFNCLFQIIWFWRYTARNINYDAISYIGIARHLVDGDFHASLQGYWSPAFSWCIAAASLFSHNFLLSARLISIASFVLCLPLIYLLSFKLWRSMTLASLSVLCFTLSRGVVALSVYFIGADFFLTAAVLAYFILLLACLRNPAPANWLKLGAVHGLASLIKAFAMPWLAVCTLLAGILLGWRNSKKVTATALLGLTIPFAVWITWGTILSTRYGRFTPGYQSKWNLLSTEAQNTESTRNFFYLTDTSKTMDKYMVVDNMYPSSPLWDQRLHTKPLATQIVRKEILNLPEAIRRIFVLITPAGIFSLPLLLRSLNTDATRSEFFWVGVVVTGSIICVLGYCMLVFDGRYVLPLIPLLMIATTPFLWPGEKRLCGTRLRAALGLLFLGSIAFFYCYKTSPFRAIRRDYQSGVYHLAAALSRVPKCNRLVVIGSGPFPAHGVGWEAGIYASYFGQCRMVGFDAEIPPDSKIEFAITDVDKLNADSVLLLDDARTGNGAALLNALLQDHFQLANAEQNPDKREIGSVLWK